MNASGWPVWVNLLLFGIAAAVVWIAGTRLERMTDAIARRTGMGKGFAGLVLLAAATSLPEIATTTTASLMGNPELAVYNLMGGVVMQTAILVVADAVAGRRALTSLTPRFSLLMEGVGLVALLAIALVAMALGGGPQISASAGRSRVSVWAALAVLAAAYLLVVWTVHRAEVQPRWRPTERSPDGGSDEPEPGIAGAERREGGRAPGGARRGGEGGGREGDGAGLARLLVGFAVPALIVLAAGWGIASLGDVLARQTGLGSSFIGATLVAAATSLPEVSTTVSAVRHGNHGMAISNIFGSNMFDTALLCLAGVLAGGAVFEGATGGAMVAAAIGILVTCVYLWGLLENRDRRVWRVGVDSAVVLVVYFVGIGALYSMRPREGGAGEAGAGRAGGGEPPVERSPSAGGGGP